MVRSTSIVVLIAACGGSTASPDAHVDDGFDRSALLAHLSREERIRRQQVTAVAG